MYWNVKSMKSEKKKNTLTIALRKKTAHIKVLHCKDKSSSDIRRYSKL